MGSSNSEVFFALVDARLVGGRLNRKAGAGGRRLVLLEGLGCLRPAFPSPLEEIWTAAKKALTACEAVCEEEAEKNEEDQHNQHNHNDAPHF